MNQREKARDFLRREGHGAMARAVNVGDADKKPIAHPHHTGRPAAAKSHQAFNAGELGDDGLLRGHLKDI
jgi:hypothetical protein